jgi:hypothetical protein
VELFFLSLYTGIRFWQLIQLGESVHFKKYSIIPIRVDQVKNEMILFILIRSTFLMLYIFIIGVSAVPYEHDYLYIHSIGHFFRNLIVEDPLFLLPVFFIVFYYLKQIFSKVDQSKAGILEFSFNLDHLDPRLIAPGWAVFTGIIVMGYFLIFTATKRTHLFNEGAHSRLYLYAIWLLFTRILVDIYLLYKMHKEMKARGLTIND